MKILRKIQQDLLEWKNTLYRKPLILRGARQVGKTFAIKMFAQNNYDKYIYLNLDDFAVKDLYSRINTVKDFIQTVKITKKVQITSHNTLVFIDEIQNCPNLLHLLRYFYEKKPNIHIISAGSLLDKLLNDKKYSVPVGRVTYLYMYPLDFFEYLKAIQQSELLEYLQGIKFGETIPPGIHQLALQQLHNYLIVGGMPEVVSRYATYQDVTMLDEIFNQLINGYIDDVLKYATKSESRYINHVLTNAHTTAGAIFKYSNYAGTNYSNKEMEPAFRNLANIMLLSQIPATKSTTLPIISDYKRPKKLIYLDIGLVTFQSKIRTQILQESNINSLFRGRIAEQVVGQNLIAIGTKQLMHINYWAMAKSKSMAEVDFCFVHNGKIIGIEVKSGATGKLRSLYVFADKVKNPVLIRLHTGGFTIQTITHNHKKYELLSIPIYLVPRLLTLL